VHKKTLLLHVHCAYRIAKKTPTTISTTRRQQLADRSTVATMPIIRAVCIALYNCGAC